MSGHNTPRKRAAKIRPSTCVNCACPRSGHLGDAPRSCLKHLECEDYRPIGKAVAQSLSERKLRWMELKSRFLPRFGE